MVETLTEPDACLWLAEAAHNVPSTQAIVEVGVYRGGSLRFLCQGARLGGHTPVFGIDPWGLDGAYPDRPHMLKRYVPSDQMIAAETAPGAILMRTFSTTAATDWVGPPIGVLFIDAVHRQADVLADFHVWQPHLVPNAVVAFDDYCPRFDGVRQAVDSLVHAGEIAPIRLVGDRLATSSLL